MKIVGKRLLCVILAVAMFGFSLQSFEVYTYAAEQEVPGINQSIEDSQRQETPEEPDINKEEAKDIAEFQVDETLENQETDWREGTKIRKVYNLYNEKEEICAYAVELKNGSEDAGYVVVGAVEDNPPIIEFQTSGRFLDEKLQSDEYLLYDGSINYYKVDKATKKAINIETDKESFSIEDIESDQEESKNDTAGIKEEWKEIKKQTGVGNSAPPTNGGEILNPNQYENGYTSVIRRTAPDATFYRYFEMTDFGPGGICVPTAACNLLKYYMERKRLKQSIVMNNDWKLTFNKLKSYFKTSDEKGTDMEDVKPGLDRYFREIGIQDAITHYYGFDGYRDAANWTEMKRRIDFGEPFIYGVSDHYWYDEHAVLAVGYVQYNYLTNQATGLKTSRYLQVVDGWEEHANRYINVHVGCDPTTDEMVSLYFVYTNIQK